MMLTMRDDLGGLEHRSECCGATRAGAWCDATGMPPVCDYATRERSLDDYATRERSLGDYATRERSNARYVLHKAGSSEVPLPVPPTAPAHTA